MTKPAEHREPEADLILSNGRIYTIDQAQPWVEAIAVRDGRIVALGAGADVEHLRGDRTRVIDLGQRMAMPGIIDVHNHHTRGGHADLFETGISPIMSLDRILDVVSARAAHLGPDEWIVGGIWGSNRRAELSTIEAKRALDSASGGRPVMFRDDTQHCRWVNSRALEIIGITAATQDPPDGTIVRDPDTGEAVGMLIGKASGMAELAARRSLPDAADRDVKAAKRAIEILNSLGVTSFQDANTLLPYLEALATLESKGELTARCVASLPARDSSFGVEIFGDDILAIAEDYRSPRVRPDFVKIFMDGVPPARTAAMLEPYAPDESGVCCFRGDALVTIPDLVRWIVKCEKRGLSVKVHCGGDAAVRATLDAIDVVRTFNGPGPRHHIAHASLVDAEDIPRFAELNVVADLSPIIWYPGPIAMAVSSALSPDRAKRFWPTKDMLEAGALLAAGSDWPVVAKPDPWLGIEGLVTRRDPTGRFPGAIWEEQALDLATVLEIYTINAARAMRLDEIAGSISIGKSADIIVLDRNLFEIAVDELADTKVLLTLFEGQQVYQASDAL